MHPEPLPNPDAVRDPLEARLRALPAPAVPATLEARLLAAVPTATGKKGDCPPKSRGLSPFLPAATRTWLARACLAGAVAAAWVLVLVAWRWHTSQPSLQPTTPKPAPYVKSPQPADEIARLTAWQGARRIEEETTLTTFVWPLPETKPVLAWNSLPVDASDR